MAALREYAGTRELVVNLTLRELRSKYKKSVLGWTWSLLNFCWLSCQDRSA